MKKVLVINSAKGGVGKTETTIGIALELLKRGEKVAILDLDVTTPNIGEIENIKTYTAGTNTMLNKAQVKRLIRTSFQDFKDGWLLIDTPPTISSLYSAITETIKHAKFLFVTTPSKNAVMDTSLGIKFFAQRGVVPIGVIQNMIGENFGEEFDSISKMGVETLGTIPLCNDTAKYFKPIVKSIEKVDFKQTYIEHDELPILSTLTEEEARKAGRSLELRFYNLETWDYIKEKMRDKEEHYLGTLSEISEFASFNISTKQLEEIINKGTSTSIMIKKSLAVENAPLPYEIQEAKIEYTHRFSKGLPVFKLDNGVVLWWHEVTLVDEIIVADIMEERGIDMGEGRIIQSLHNQLYFHRAFERNAINTEKALIEKHIKETKLTPESKEILYSLYLLEKEGTVDYENFDMENYIESQKENYPDYHKHLNEIKLLGINTNMKIGA